LTDKKNLAKMNFMWAQGNVVRKDDLQKKVFARRKNSIFPFSQENYISQIERRGMKNVWRELCDFLIRAEGFMPRCLRRNKGYKTRLRYLMRTTYLDTLRRGMLIRTGVQKFSEKIF